MESPCLLWSWRPDNPHPPPAPHSVGSSYAQTAESSYSSGGGQPTPHNPGELCNRTPFSIFWACGRVQTRSAWRDTLDNSAFLQQTGTGRMKVQCWLSQRRGLFWKKRDQPVQRQKGGTKTHTCSCNGRIRIDAMCCSKHACAMFA